MHEYSLARNILETVSAERAERQLGPISRIDLELGEFSGVEILQLQSALDDLSPTMLGNQPEVCIHMVPLRGSCQACRHEFLIGNFRFQCPECACCDVAILSGEELRIVSICVLQESNIP